MEEEKRGGTFLTAMIVVLVLAVAGYGVFRYTKRETTPTESTNTIPSIPTEQTVFRYKDGQYFAQGGYISPGGSEDIEVTLTIKDDIITDVVVTPLATRPTSVTMQGKFASGVKAVVVGKRLDDVVLTNVSGSSLTPKGWNDAITKIQAQARV